MPGAIPAGPHIIGKVGLVDAGGTAITESVGHTVKVSGAVTSSGTVTANQGTAGAAAWPVTDAKAAAPTTYNVTLTNADTEYSQALPANCRGFEFQCRTEATVRFAFATGKVATPTAPYHTLKAGDYYSSPPISQAASPSTLYLASATAGVVVEILAWS